jgi:hypothetical protein
LIFRRTNPKQAFVRGDKPALLPVVVGTPGLGKATFVVLLSAGEDPPAVAEIAFPNRQTQGQLIIV